MPTFLGSNIKFLRRLKGISQQKLAEAVQLKRNNIASYESGAVEPKAINFLKLARFFEVSPVELLTNDLSQNPLEQMEAPAVEEPKAPEILLSQLEEFITETSEMQKVVDGFRELQKFKAQQGSEEQLPSDLIDILEHLLKSNWQMVQGLQGEAG
ncbi:MAG: helix-turn-helix transcriptional regulator [Bacteroidota bacterium]